MMKKYIYFLWLCISSQVLLCQQVCNGILLDSTSKNPVEFANIGIPGKGIGTVTDANGAYKLRIPDSLAGDIIKISMIGYRTKTYTVNQFSQKQSIRLVPSITTLEGVTVSAAKLKVKIAGHNTETKTIGAGFFNNGLGAELAVKLSIKHPQTQIRKFMLNVTKNSLNKTPVFRFNVYKADKDGRPGENILKQNIIISPATTTGLIELDLMPYSIFVNEDVFISIEWIKDLGDTKGLYFSTRLTGGTYYRVASQDGWKRTAVGIGLHAEVAY